MNCLEYRKAVAAEPARTDQALTDHEAACRACAAFSHKTRALDEVLKAALAVDVPDNLAAKILLSRAGQRRRVAPGLVALAATLVLGVGVAAMLWLANSASALPEAVMAHVKHEPNLLLLVDDQVSFAKVNTVLARGRVSLNGDIGTVQHAGLCPFRGNLVPHLVVTGERGPVTVLLLRDEIVTEAQPIDEEGFKGVIIPAGRGSIAIVGIEDEPLEGVKTKFVQSIEWSI